MGTLTQAARAHINKNFFKIKKLLENMLKNINMLNNRLK